MPSANHKETSKKSDRAAVLGLIETPIRFFALVVLVVELLLGSLVAVTTGVVQLLFVGTLLLILIFLVATVAYFAFSRPEALTGKRPPTSRVQLSTGLLDLLSHITHSPAPASEYAEYLEGQSYEGDNGWHKAAVYGCLLLSHLRLVEVSDGVVRITERGKTVIRPYISSRPVDAPKLAPLPDDDELLSEQRDT